MIFTNGKNEKDEYGILLVMNQYRLALIMSFNNKPDRERVSGVLRFAAQRPEWEVRILDSSSDNFRADCKQALAGNWRPNACIYSNYRAYTNFIRGLSPEKRGLSPVGEWGLSPIRVEIDAEPNRVPPAIDVHLDSEALVSAALGLLLQRGYTNVAHFGTTDSAENYYSELQKQHFIALSNKKQLSCSTFSFNRQQSTNHSLSEAAQWISRLAKPCGIIAYSDNIARDLLDACRLAQVSVPEQVAIIGIDNNTELCENSRPTLSSIQPDFESSGYLAAEALDRVWSASPSPSLPLSLTYGIKGIHERASTQDLRGCGRIAAAAQRILRAEAMTPITIRDIAKRLNLSLRLLEIDYLKVNGRTLKSDLTELRLQRLRERLQSETTPMGELALSCGFKTANTAQVAFRKRFGMSMRACRMV